MASKHTHMRAMSGTASIDGASHPELISDQEAITIWLISLMEAPESGEPEKSRFRAKIARMKLSADDTAYLWNVGLNFYNQYMPYRQQAQQLAQQASGASSSTIAQINNQRAAVAAAIDRLAMSTYSEAMTSLTQSGANNPEAHIAYVKTRMTIVLPPKM